MSFGNAWNHFNESIKQMGGKNTAEINDPVRYQFAVGLVNLAAGLTNLEQQINNLEMKINQASTARRS
jgi:hypothetical protein